MNNEHENMTNALRHAMAGGEVRARVRVTGKEYAVKSFIMPCPAIPYPMVSLAKPFGNHRLSDVDFILKPNSHG
jgi:hypothetical protein